MRYLIIISYVSYISLVLTGCHSESETLSGNVMGNVLLLDENSNHINDNSGVTVTIRDNSFSATAITDQSGNFLITGVPWGKYNIEMNREGFLASNNLISDSSPLKPLEFYHLGGESPTYLQYNMYALPDFRYHLDSISSDADHMILQIYGTGPDLSQVPYYGYFYYYFVVCFFNDNENVSKDNFKFYVYGCYAQWGYHVAPYIYAYTDVKFYDVRNRMTSDSLYLCVYPLAMSETTYLPVRSEALGKPSNVLPIPWN